MEVVGRAANIDVTVRGIGNTSDLIPILCTHAPTDHGSLRIFIFVVAPGFQGWNVLRSAYFLNWARQVGSQSMQTSPVITQFTADILGDLCKRPVRPQTLLDYFGHHVNFYCIC